MDQNIQHNVISKAFTYYNAIELLSFSELQTFPVVDNLSKKKKNKNKTICFFVMLIHSFFSESMRLLGCIEREALNSCIEEYFRNQRSLQADLVSQRHQKQTNVNLTTSKANFLPESMDYLQQNPGKLIKSVPVQLEEKTPLTIIHMLFITLRLTDAFVTDTGILVGFLTRKKLKQVVANKDNLTTFLDDAK